MRILLCYLFLYLVFIYFERREESEGRMTFDPKGTPTFRLRYQKCGVVEKDEEILLALTEAALRDMEEMLL